MSKHSLAPWRFVADSFDKETFDYLKKDVPYDYHSGEYADNPFIVDANGETVVGCDEYYVFSKPENVRLMVHAPELLEALKLGITAIGEHNAPNDCYSTGPLTGTINDHLCPACAFLKQARQAIAKAEGAP
jgi:hypothetical protein